MFRLASMMFAIVGTTLAGTAVIVALVVGMDQWQHLASAALAGGVLAMPVSLMIARKLVA